MHLRAVITDYRTRPGVRRDVSLDLVAGEVLWVRGADGVGTSTLLRIIVGGLRSR